MVNDLKAGDRIVTSGGIHGMVSSLKGPIILMKIADNVRVEVSRTAIAQVIQEPPKNPIVAAPAASDGGIK